MNDLLGSFNILSDSIVFYGSETSFLEISQNGALVSSVEWDFNWAIDLFLFDIEESVLMQRFSDVSNPSLWIAMPDEESDDPELFWLWQNSVAVKWRIIEDDKKFFLQ